MKALKWIGIVMGGLLVLCCVGAMLMPNEWAINTSVEIDGSRAEIYPHISTPRMFTTHTESYAVTVGQGGLTKFEYSEIEQGEGAWWTAKSDGSNVRIDIVKADPAEGMWYEGMIESDEVNSEGSLLMEDLGDGRTRLTWDDRGTVAIPLVGGAMVPLINSMLGDFFHGTLLEIKAVVEGGGDDDSGNAGDEDSGDGGDGDGGDGGDGE